MIDRIGTTVYDVHGRPYRLTRLVARGGQGAVYEEESGQNIVKVAIANGPAHELELRRRYQWLLQREIHRSARLVVPEALLASPLGYVMRRVKGHQPLSALLRPPATASLGEWYNRNTGGLRRRLLLGAQIARAFHHLHIAGLAYCDLSDTNILAASDPALVSTCIIDPDNLSVSGDAESLVLGTPRYMAPEVVRGLQQPNSLTDSYALAVLLFQLLRLNHPLLGDEVQQGPPELEEQALCGEWPYIEHPDDDTNRCATVLPTDAVCSQTLTGLFLRTFTTGLHRSRSRPTPGEWEESCLMAADNLAVCAYCGADLFPRPEPTQRHLTRCPWCGELNPRPPMLRFSEVAYSEHALHMAKGSSSQLILGRDATTVTARHAIRGEAGEAGDHPIAVLRKVGDGDFTIENRWSASMQIVRPSDNGWVVLKPGAALPFPANSRVFFGTPWETTMTRFASLVDYGSRKGAQ